MLILRGVGSIVRDLPESNGKRKVDIDGDRGDEWVHDDQKRTGGNDDEGGDDCGDRVDL